MLLQLCFDVFEKVMIINFLIKQVKQAGCFCDLDAGGLDNMGRCVTRVDWDGKGNVRVG